MGQLHAPKNMTHAVLPRSEVFHLRLEVQARAWNERQRGTIGLRVRHLSLSSLTTIIAAIKFECWDTTEPRAVPTTQFYSVTAAHLKVMRHVPSRVPGAWASPSLGGGGVAAAHSQTSHPVLSVGPC
ncbi:hypothetical protein J6590_064135 [Homalodisca vitripennis]|nr:hypothetical protein J6590_064135 [Homalodisca vitripennis]